MLESLVYRVIYCPGCKKTKFYNPATQELPQVCPACGYSTELEDSIKSEEQKNGFNS